MKYRATSILLTGALGLGGMTTALVLAPAIAQAQTTETSTADAVGDRVSRIREALSGLVSGGTLTQAQADQVATTLAEELPRHGGHGGRGGGRHLASAAEVIGISEDELRTALSTGQSLAQVAEAQGVDRQALIDGLVAAASGRLDEEVAEGDLTQAEADEREAELAERVAEKVDRVGLPHRGHHGGPRRGGEQGAPTG